MKFDFSKLDLTKLDISKWDITKVDINHPKVLQAIAGAFLLIIVTIDLILFLPLIGKSNQAHEQQRTTMIEIDFVKASLLKEKGLKDVKILDQEKIDDLMDRIIVLGKENGIRVVPNGTVENSKKQNKDAAYIQKTLTMDAFGSFKGLGFFLTVLKNMQDATVDLDSIKLQRKERDFTKVQAHITLILLTTKDDENK